MIKTFIQAFFIRRAYQITKTGRLYAIFYGFHDIYNGLISVVSLGNIHCSTSMEYCFNETYRKHFEKVKLNEEKESRENET